MATCVQKALSDARTFVDINEREQMQEKSDEELELVGPSKSLFEKGGSLAVCIPSRIVKYLDLHARDQLIFTLDKKNRRLLAGKKDSMTIRIGESKVAFYNKPLFNEFLRQIHRSTHGNGTTRHSR